MATQVPEEGTVEEAPEKAREAGRAEPWGVWFERVTQQQHKGLGAHGLTGRPVSLAGLQGARPPEGQLLARLTWSGFQ